MKYLKLLFIIILTSCATEKSSNLKLMDLFSDGMVLQQKYKTKIWGISNPNTEINIEGSWGNKSTTKSDSNGNWIAEIDTPIASGPYSLKITDGLKTKEISDILIGEVWFASGQSNMEMPLEGYLPREPIDNAEKEISNSFNNKIRMFTVTNNVTLSKIDTVDGIWLESNPKNSRYFSATGYFFAKKL